MHSRRRAIFVLLLSLVVMGLAINIVPRSADNVIALLILAWFVLGSALLMIRALRAPRGQRRHFFYSGGLALYPESWRRWLLDEREIR